VEWSGRHLTPAGGRGKAKTPQAKLRRFGFLPGESCVWSAMEQPVLTLPPLFTTKYAKTYINYHIMKTKKKRANFHAISP